MGFLRASLTLLMFGLAVPPAVAADAKACLSSDERRAIIETRKAVPLARAMHVVKSKLTGDVVKVRLCRQEAGSGKGLVYVLTVLSRNGKVSQARVDADDGHWLGAT
jgi:uncharacterized membrane protein YkoI